MDTSLRQDYCNDFKNNSEEQNATDKVSKCKLTNIIFIIMILHM